MTGQEELAYLAGIVDGEGSIVIVSFRAKYVKKDGTITRTARSEARISICNTNVALMHWLHEHFGGHWRENKHNGKPDHYKASYIWMVHCISAVKLAEALLPYLVLKRGQAEVIIRYQQTKSRQWSKLGMPKDVLELRDSCVSRIRAMNRRGRYALEESGRDEAHKEGRVAEVA